MGFAFLTEGAHFFPLRLTKPLTATDPAQHPALWVFAALHQALSNPADRAAAEAALNHALKALGPAAVDPQFRAMIDRCWRESAPAAKR